MTLDAFFPPLLERHGGETDQSATPNQPWADQFGH